MLKLCKREWNEHGPHGIGAIGVLTSEELSSHTSLATKQLGCHQTGKQKINWTKLLLLEGGDYLYKM